MTKFIMPSPDELRKEYGGWEQNLALQRVADWMVQGRSGESVESFERESLDRLAVQRAHFENLAGNLSRFD